MADKAANQAQDQPSTSNPRVYAHDVNEQDKMLQKPPTGALITFFHLAKGYVGTGIFAMGSGFASSGLIAGPVCLTVIALINLHCQHLLMKAVEKVCSQEERVVKPSFGETVHYSLDSCPVKFFRNHAKKFEVSTNICLCACELGFCSVYFIFIVKHLLAAGAELNIITKEQAADAGMKHALLAIVLIPMWLSTFITNLKFLFPLSVISNVLMWAATIIIYYFTTYLGLPPATERNLIVEEAERWPAFFGIALFAFEGITFIIPLRNEMRKPEQFTSSFGVLNLSIVFVAILYITVGLFSYWKYGDNVKSSVFLNFEEEDATELVTAVYIMLSLAILFTFTLHMYVPLEITFPLFYRKYGPFKHNRLVMYLYRTAGVLLTYFLANAVPFLSVFIGLIGAVLGSYLAIILPAGLHIAAFKEENSKLVVAKDALLVITDSKMSLPRDCLILKNDPYPSIFSNLPYLKSEAPSVKCNDPSDRCSGVLKEKGGSIKNGLLDKISI